MTDNTWAALSRGARIAGHIVRKDFRTEWRSREVLATMLLFALLSVLVFSFALELDRLAREEAVAGVLWVTIVFASTLGLNRSMASERENGNLQALLIAPIPRLSVFWGKALSSFVFALAVGLVLLLTMAILYNLPLLSPMLLLFVVLGAYGISCIGTLLATMAVQTRSRETLLPIAMLPVLLPLLLGVVRASTSLIAASPMATWLDWLPIVLVIDIIYTLMAVFLFRFTVEQ